MESSSGDQPKEHRVMEQPVQPVQDAGPYGPTGPWTDYRASGARVFGPTGPLDRFAGRLRPALVTTTPNLMVCTLVEPSVARPTHTGEDCNEPWRELGAAGSGAGVSSRVSRARSPPARLNHFAMNFKEKRVQKNRAPIPSCPEHPNYEKVIQT